MRAERRALRVGPLDRGEAAGRLQSERGLEQEQQVSRQIDHLYETAFNEKAFAAVALILLYGQLVGYGFAGGTGVRLLSLPPAAG